MNTIERGDRVVIRKSRESGVLVTALDGRKAVVEGMEVDDLGRSLVAVVLDDDPAHQRGERHLAHRFLLSPEDVERVVARSRPRILVGGIGNVYAGDDGFGVAVVRSLAARRLPASVHLVEFGVRGMDLVYALGDGYGAAILVDTASLHCKPGTVDILDALEGSYEPPPVQGHGLYPTHAIALARSLGPTPPIVLLVACQPDLQNVPPDGEANTSLSAAVARSVKSAANAVLACIEGLLSDYFPNAEEPATR
ncbi:MAG: hydrogenase maturation protease [Candidatus Eremiobacteraeota bacterium]|nr:hydrogenase maturation protease [Candidatus Eremiobacteraeota bacterium]